MSQAAAHPDPEPGTVVAERYRIVDLLGRGGMGAVYRVEHVKLKKEMALKILRPEISKLDDVAKRFEREAEAAARLDHPNIISVTDFGSTADGQLFLVMELLNGPSLAKTLAKDGAMPAPRALHIIRQVLSALQRAHSAGVVHRDLKPDNIVLVEREGERDVVKLLDFGIAKLVASDGTGEQLTRAGAIFGTPQYFSPEQAMGEPVDARADLYAAGVMMYEMLSGQRPFEAQSVVELISMHVTRDPAPVSQLAPHIPPALSESVARAMSKRRADRFPDASAMWQALQAGAGVVPPVGLSGAFLSPMGTPPFGAPIVQPPPQGPRTAPLPAVTAPPALAPTMPSMGSSPPASGLPAWLTRKMLMGIAAGVVVLLGLIIFAVTRDGPTTFGAAVEQKARATEIIDRLQNGRTCRERRVAALELIALDDPRYLEVLRGARDRRGGWFGLQSANGCVSRELDAAIRKLEAQK
jgi:eukaryotic-like serine/threonine-protein kinase